MSELKDTIKLLRRSFDFVELNEDSVSKNPLLQFEAWMMEALEADVKEPNAMTLATVDKKGFPAARIVLLRGVDKKGFSFFTNYKSAKANELAGKKACLNFFWAELSRQVRIIGSVSKLSAKESDEYFDSRPRESQIGAWASEQSAVIKDRKYLEERFNHFNKQFEGKNVKRPPHWGGYLIVPKSIEFWQGRPNRLHDRVLYEKQKSGKWKISRLSP